MTANPIPIALNTYPPPFPLPYSRPPSTPFYRNPPSNSTFLTPKPAPAPPLPPPPPPHPHVPPTNPRPSHYTPTHTYPPSRRPATPSHTLHMASSRHMHNTGLPGAQNQSCRTRGSETPPRGIPSPR